jgi:N-acetylneuraminate epimerase
MNKSFYLSFIFLMSIVLSKGMAQSPAKPLIFSNLQSIPDPIGFAGSYAGVSNGTLLVAGGANFPDGGAPWTGSKKVWHDHIFALEKPGGKWKLAGKLPHSLGYGASVTWKDALIIIGGSNEKGHYADVLMLKYVNGKIQSTSLPALPKPIANTSGVLIGDVVYIAGGIETPDAKNAEKNFWALDLHAEQKNWKILEAWPGPSRMFAVTGALGVNFYLFSGGELENGIRNYLKDAYQYTPDIGWKKLADLPNSVTAAPSPAYAAGQSHLLIFGGDDGKLAAEAPVLKEKHPGFSRQVLNYNTLTNTWSVSSQLPPAPAVTTTLTLWNGNVIIPGGEVRPAVRTPKVLVIKPIK